MDNKKWYKRFGTIFWWLLTILPIIVALIYFIGYHLTFNSGITSATELASYQSDSIGNFYSYLSSVLQNDFNRFTMSIFSSTFSDLFNLLGIPSRGVLGILLGYMVSIQIYHLVFDLFAWLPCFFHKMLEKSNIGE